MFKTVLQLKNVWIFTTFIFAFISIFLFFSKTSLNPTSTKDAEKSDNELAETKAVVNFPKELQTAIEDKIAERKLLAPEGYLPYRPDTTNNTRLSKDENWVFGVVIAPQGKEIIESHPDGSTPATEFFVGKKEKSVWKLVIDNTGENIEFLKIINQLPEELLGQKTKDYFNSSYRKK